MPDLTNDQLETMILQLQTRLIKLPTTAQITELLGLLNDYKLETDTRLQALEDRMDAVEGRLNDIELRLQALE